MGNFVRKGVDYNQRVNLKEVIRDSIDFAQAKITQNKVVVSSFLIDSFVVGDSVSLEQVFESFFTTKEKGKGTGLGLANVVNIVEKSGGEISLQSEVGVGTKFSLILKRYK